MSSMGNTALGFTVTYGERVTGTMGTLFVPTVDEVRKLAKEFIQVIPGPLAPLRKEIREWNGQDHLDLSDKVFYFQVTPIEQKSYLVKAFNQFVARHRLEDEGETTG